jgi:hypothetical protein
MNLLPYENITYKTWLKEEEVVRRLSEVVAPERGQAWNKYKGKIDGREFNIVRIIDYQNSFLPKISGTIERDFVGTRITVKMRLPDSVIAFMIVWLGGVSLAIAFYWLQALDNSEFDSAILVPSGMFVFGIVLTIGAFKRESIKSKNELQTLFEAEIEP